ncbi:MAG: FGGY family carbohydrate kinase [Clostridia bacterium]
MGYYLGIDVGGSGIKGVLADEHGNVIAEEQVSYTIAHEHVGWAEQDAELWWQGAKKILQTCVNANPIVKDELQGIMICGMVPNLVPIDCKGKLIRPAILYRDNRALEECRYLNGQYGTNFNMQDVTPKWTWLKNHEPENFAKIALILNTHSFIAYKLTGIANADADTASLLGEGVYDQTTGWNKQLLEQIGLPVSVLPPCFYPGEIVGNITLALQQEFGFTKNIPVLAGNGDSLAAMLGTGVVNADDAMIYLGTAATLWYMEEDLAKLAHDLIFASGKLHFVGNALTGGELARWFRTSMQLSGESFTLAELEAGAKIVAAGSEGLFFLPHLMGMRTPIANPLASGSILGISPTHTALHIYRALMEGVAYSLYDSYQASGKKAQRLVITGGGAKCTLWREIIANVFNLPVEYYAKSDGALGVAYFTAYSLGEFTDFAPLRYGWLGESATVKPTSELVATYKTSFRKYLKLDKKMQDCYQILNLEG